MDSRRRSTYRRARISQEKEKTTGQKILVYTYKQTIFTMILFALFLGVRLVPIEATKKMSVYIEDSISENTTWKDAYEMAYNTFVNIPYMKRFFMSTPSIEPTNQMNEEKEMNKNMTLNEEESPNESIEPSLPIDEFKPTEKSDFLDQTSVGK